MARFTLVNRAQWLPIAATILFTAALTALLAYGMQRASRLQSASAALQLASELGAQPSLLRSELTLIQRGLETQTYVGDSLRTVAASNTASERSFKELAARINEAQLQRDAAISSRLNSATASWQPINQQLQALANARSDQLYADSVSGSTLTLRGQQLKDAVDEVLTAQTQQMRVLTASLGELAGALRGAVVQNGQSLRSLLLAGTALAGMLLAMMLYFALRARRSQAAARSAQHQVENILGTVREGLFLVDRNGTIGAAHSDSLASLLHCASPAGQSLEDLLRPLVTEKTLTAAIKYLGLLWKDRVNEELIESVNPLNCIEVSLARNQGGRENRYLSFMFRRARDAGDYLLVAVADITDQVLLQRELEQLKSSSDSQGELLLQLLRIDPLQLDGLLVSANQAFRRCNALLIAPGKELGKLREKLDGVFRELHSVKGEAAALGLEGFAGRIHQIEDILAGLRAQSELSGDQFLPVVTKLDDLIEYAVSLGDARERVATLPQQAAGLQRGQAPLTDEQAAATIPTLPSAPMPAAALESLLKSLASEVSRAYSRTVQLKLDGLQDVPPEHANRIKDICVQMIRNSVAHGIEAPEKRAVAGKPPGGTVRIKFEHADADNYGLLIEDDGQGLSYEHILNRALQLDLVRPQQAVEMERGAVLRLIFHPGFSTATAVSEHAGRGVGLDVVNATVRDCGGRIGISTAPGKYTRFKVLLPKSAALQSSAA